MNRKLENTAFILAVFFLCVMCILLFMQISGEGVILKVKPQSKGAYLLVLFSKDYGLLKGFATGSKKVKADFEIGNVVEFAHTRRLDHQLGVFYIDVLKNIGSRNLSNVNFMLILQYLCDLHLKFLAEELPLPNLYQEFLKFLEKKHSGLWFALGLYEVKFLQSIGYGLSMDEEDAVRGEGDNSPLFYVSPKSGRAVTKRMGEPYKDRMLVLPHVFGGQSKEILDLLNLTGHFLRVAFDGDILPSRSNLLQIAVETNFGEDKYGCI